ncbi:MAG: endonuclease III domain-containing protein [Thermodesulfobacteriota bacterium]
MAGGSNKIEDAYHILLEHFGPQDWWPAESPFEVMVGAVLTQNTNWQNVEKAIGRLKEADLLSFDRLLQLGLTELAEYIRPAGYYNLKAGRLKNLLQMIDERYDGDLDALFQEYPDDGRAALLAVKGVGPETADSILLYAGGHPVFVVDAYTHRVFSRHNLVPEESSYWEIQQAFSDSLDEDASLFNEYHALIVTVAKKYCKKKSPDCDNCPLKDL